MSENAFQTGESVVILNCSMCGKPYEPALVNTRPFCSVRCQQIDLGRWLDESYGLPLEHDIEYDESRQLPDDDSSDVS